MHTDVFIVVGALVGGFVSGLAGFGTGLTALGFWLYVVEPVVAGALVVVCSVVAQVQSLHAFRRTFTWRRAWPFIIGGIAGIPLGVTALRVIEPKTLKFCLGLLLVIYAAVTIGFRRLPKIAWGGKAADGVAGFGGGVLGGVAGLSGPLPIIWCGLRGWTADAQRGVYQPYNLTVLMVTLCVYAAQGILTVEVWELVAVSLPATLLGVYAGIRMYGRVDDRKFRYVVLSLLMVSGVVLVASNMP